MAAGEPFGITPYGTEAMHVLRAEKGYVIVGQDTDGTVTPIDLGHGLDRRRRRSRLRRAALARAAPIPRAPTASSWSACCRRSRGALPEGAQLVDDARASPAVAMVGHVTSSYCSAALGPHVRAGACCAPAARWSASVVHVPCSMVARSPPP